MKIIKNPEKETWEQLITRPKINYSALEHQVKQVFFDVQKKGDAAVKKYTEQYDGVIINELKVTRTELEESEKLLSQALKDSIWLAKENIERFHATQRDEIKYTETMSGVMCWRATRPIENIGLYIPGGSAPLFSTVLMLAVPARIAGCKKVILCSPPGKDGKIHPAILYCAKISGVTDVYKVGGIQAIGAMAFGTETIDKVYKIFGPGNQYVMCAKQLITGKGVAIDMPAGPSEVLVIADDTAIPEFVAADLLSQAEHGADSQVVLLCNSEKFVNSVHEVLQSQLEKLPRKETAEKAIENSFSIIFDDTDDCMEFSNFYAPEHLIIATKDYKELAEKVINAGSVFLGNYSCESVGDYASGTNHTLPTNGFAKSYSGVSLDSFLKKITFQEVTRDGLENIGKAVEYMAEAEHLQAHKNAVSIRLKMQQ